MKALHSLAMILALPAAALAATTPFDVSSGRPMVQLHVNGEGPYPFVVDTGAPGLILRQELVDELGLEVVGSTEVNSPIGGTPVPADLVRVSSIALGEVAVEDLQAIVLSIGGDALGMGIVGPAVFREHGSFQLDFVSNTLSLGADATAPEAANWLPFGPSAPLLDVPVVIGELTIDGHIDTGSPGVLTLPPRHREALPLSGPVRTVGRARTVDAEFDILAAAIDAFARVGDATVPLREIYLAQLPVANLGTAGLRGLNLYIDWQGERFALTGSGDPAPPPQHTARGGSGPRFGISARPLPDGTIEVVGTEPGSPAESMGLLAGDRIVAIQGQSLSDLGMANVRGELARPDLVLTVDRDGERVELSRID